MKAFVKPIYITRPIFPKLADFNKKLEDIWHSKILSNYGIQAKTLENKLKKVLKSNNLHIFNNGTIALLIGIRSLHLKGEVITTPFTFPATVNCLIWNNLTPVFCDIDPNTMNIDVDKIELLITSKTSAILAVHVFGSPCDVEKIQKIADKYKLKVIYDAAHAFETEINHKSIASYGDLTMFSFHPTKLFHTGEGGALVFKDANIGFESKMLGNFGIKNEEEVTVCGINGKINEMQSALGLLVLECRNKERARRKLIKGIYQKMLADVKGISFVRVDKKETKSSYQYLTIRIDENEFGRSRDFVYKEFKKYNVFTRKYFYPLCSDYPFCKNFKSAKKENLPVANKVVNEILAMPFYGNLKISDVKKICKILISFRKINL